MTEQKNSKSKVEKIDVSGETCPVPLVETRKAIRRVPPGGIVEVTGDHPPSKKEIPMAVEEMGLELLKVIEEDGEWRIRIRVGEEDE